MAQAALSKLCHLIGDFEWPELGARGRTSDMLLISRTRVEVKLVLSLPAAVLPMPHVENGMDQLGVLVNHEREMHQEMLECEMPGYWRLYWFGGQNA